MKHSIKSLAIVMFALFGTLLILSTDDVYAKPETFDHPLASTPIPYIAQVNATCDSRMGRFYYDSHFPIPSDFWDRVVDYSEETGQICNFSLRSDGTYPSEWFPTEQVVIQICQSQAQTLCRNPCFKVGQVRLTGSFFPEPYVYNCNH